MSQNEAGSYSPRRCLVRTLLLASTALFVTGISGQPVSAAGAFIAFDAPGGALATFPLNISRLGDVVGRYVDADDKSHGFLRSPNGAIQTIDVPGAAQTAITGINTLGTMIGSLQTTAPLGVGPPTLCDQQGRRAVSRMDPVLLSCRGKMPSSSIHRDRSAPSP